MGHEQTLRTGAEDDKSLDQAIEYEDQVKIKNDISNSHRIDITPGFIYFGATKVYYPGGFISTIVATGTYDLVLSNLGVLSFIAPGTEAALQISLYRLQITDTHVTAILDLRVGQSKGGAGGAGGVNTQHATVAVDTPATTINFGEGLDAAGGAGTTTVDTDWNAAPSPVAAAGNAGALTDVSRGDHAHEGVHSIAKLLSAQLKGDVTLSEGANITLTQVGQDVSIAAAGGGGPAPGADIQDVKNANAAGGNAAYARDDHEHEGLHSIAKSGGSPQLVGDATLTQGAGILLTQVGQDIAIEATGAAAVLDNVEKPWDYHEVTMMTPDSNNGKAGQRCVTMVSDQNSVYILWHDDDDFNPQMSLFLSVYRRKDEAWHHTFTHELSMASYGDPGEPLAPIFKDFCLTAAYGLFTEKIHIVFTSRANQGTETNVYDAYIRTADIVDPVLGAPPTPFPLLAERVNTIAGAAGYECTNVSACAVPGLSAGPGIVVTWTQSSDGASRIHSNFFDESSVDGNRYSGIVYSKLIASDGNTQDAADLSTVEANNDYIYCSYIMNGRLYASRMGSSGIAIVPTIWDSIIPSGSPIDSLGTLALATTAGPTMVLFENTIAPCTGTYIMICVANSNDPSYPVYEYLVSDDIFGPTALLIMRDPNYVQFNPGTYTPAVLGDIGLMVTAPSGAQGILTAYDNTLYVWEIQPLTVLAFVPTDVITVTAGTGAGTAIAANSRNQELISNVGTYVPCIATDIGLPVTGSVSVANGTLVWYDNANQLWIVHPVTPLDIFQIADHIAVTGGNGEGDVVNVAIEEYVDCVPGDVNKIVTSPSANGILLSYDNGSRSWTVTTFDTFITTELITALTGYGTLQYMNPGPTTPTLFQESNVDTFDLTHGCNILGAYQLGMSALVQAPGDADSLLFYLYHYGLSGYFTMLEEENYTFYLNYANLKEILSTQTQPWKQIPLVENNPKSEIRGAIGVFGPHVHYSHEYYQRTWKTRTLGTPYYPTNVASKTVLGWRSQAAPVLTKVLILKDIPLYTLGYLPPAAPP